MISSAPASEPYAWLHPKPCHQLSGQRSAYPSSMKAATHSDAASDSVPPLHPAGATPVQTKQRRSRFLAIRGRRRLGPHLHQGGPLQCLPRSCSVLPAAVPALTLALQAERIHNSAAGETSQTDTHGTCSLQTPIYCDGRWCWDEYYSITISRSVSFAFFCSTQISHQPAIDHR